MPRITLSTTAVLLIENNPKRKFVSFTNIDNENYAFISDEGKPTQTSAKWSVPPNKTLIITRAIGFPDRAFYGVGDGSLHLLVGFQNEGELQK